LFSGNREKSTSCSRDGLFPVVGLTGAPETTGEKMISPMQAISPP
jgi:hypothetical protein